MHPLVRGLVCFLIGCSAVLAQTSTAQISGTVKDESGVRLVRYDFRVRPGCMTDPPKLIVTRDSQP